MCAEARGRQPGHDPAAALDERPADRVVQGRLGAQQDAPAIVEARREKWRLAVWVRIPPAADFSAAAGGSGRVRAGTGFGGVSSSVLCDELANCVGREVGSVFGPAARSRETRRILKFVKPKDAVE